MIDLTDQPPFGAGANRNCFLHPDDSDLCLKVLQAGAIQARYEEQPLVKRLLGRRRLSDNYQEQKGYQQSAVVELLATGKGALLWQHLPRFYGTAMTTHGQANVCELIRDAEGRPAPTLEHWIARHGVDEAAKSAAECLCRWLQCTGLLTRNLLPQNLVMTDRSGHWELFIVDGLGAPVIPNLLAVFPPWRTRYINRRVQRFWLRMAWEAGGRATDWKTAGRL